MTSTRAMPVGVGGDQLLQGRGPPRPRSTNGVGRRRGAVDVELDDEHAVALLDHHAFVAARRWRCAVATTDSTPWRASEVSRRRPGRTDTTWVPSGGASPGTVSSTSPLRGRAAGFTAIGAVAAGGIGDGRDGPVDQALGDGAGLVEAVDDGPAHLVDRAGADRVVGASCG